ncbi:MAG: hypothetical protein KDI44_15345 [Thiothrix sp.]|nr:hypothetical protein [Thiothrix sp.]HPQ96391.1 hypothetical protein [Thiolinea sp.]
MGINLPDCKQISLKNEHFDLLKVKKTLIVNKSGNSQLVALVRAGRHTGNEELP